MNNWFQIIITILSVASHTYRCHPNATAGTSSQMADRTEELVHVLNDTDFNVYKSSIFFSTIRWPYLAPVGPSGYFVCWCPPRTGQDTRPVTITPQTSPTPETTPPTPDTTPSTPSPPTDNTPDTNPPDTEPTEPTNPPTPPTDGQSEDTTQPQEETTQPQEETTQPEEDTTQPQEDTTQPTEATQPAEPTEGQTEAPEPTEAQSAPTPVPTQSTSQTEATRVTESPAAAPTLKRTTRIPIIIKTFVNKVLNVSRLKTKKHKQKNNYLTTSQYTNEHGQNSRKSNQNELDHSHVTTARKISPTLLQEVATNLTTESTSESGLKVNTNESKRDERDNPIDEWNTKVLERRQRIEKLGEKYRRIKRRKKRRREQ